MNAPARNPKLLKGDKHDWEVVIGMEIHAQVTSNAKLFSGASTGFGGEPTVVVTLEALGGRGPRPADPDVYDARSVSDTLRARLPPR